MRTIFADTFYWVSLANPKDDWHTAVKRVSREIEPVFLITTDEVLTEFLTFYSKFGTTPRKNAVAMVHAIRANPNVRAIPQTRASFDHGLRFYESRADKEYSLTDCISMEVMREHGLHEVLTNDHHFEQEGFTILIK